jgi:broad specificity phosphatase PhoE
MKVVLMRHGESEYNVKKLINIDPTVDVPMTPHGFSQAREAAAKLIEYDFDVIIHSEFMRTKQTAEIVNEKRGIPMLVDGRLNEANVGYEGKPDDDYNMDRIHDPFNYKLKGRENWQDLKVRVKGFLDWIKEQDYECVLIVAHQWTGSVFYELIHGVSDQEGFDFKMDNCEFFEFEV